ncbi:MAG: sulfur reduction protein DsrJ [Pseudomonadota bacterium]|nr:sulfur reduction protein DsrJ [Pseudomonadota bacterium]MED5275193.1 sulfur reduction protein DsrJ [Pseudomonadota bacterium]MED5430385.1 sulfur reduction protein DsrJ [Pseudomonadota bacterium]
MSELSKSSESKLPLLFRTFPIILILISTSTTFSHDGQIHKFVGKSKADLLESCVEPTDVMRKKHFEFLYHQRDLTVIDGVRTTKHSLANCIDCHVSRDEVGNFIPINEEGQFCYTCHIETATNIDCFSCHASVPRHNEVKTNNRNQQNSVSAIHHQLENIISR